MARFLRLLKLEDFSSYKIDYIVCGGQDALG
jgi:hypothetical protein